MTVKELIEALNKCPMDAKVVVNDPDWDGFETDDFCECIDVRQITAKADSTLEHCFSLDDDGETVVYLKDDREKDTSDDYDYDYDDY